MNDKDEPNEAFDDLMSTWMKTAGDFWNNIFRTWSDAGRHFYFQDATTKGGKGGRTQASMASTFKTFQAISSAMFGPNAIASLFKGTDAMPEVLVKMAQSVFNGFLQMQYKLMERGGRIGKSVEAFKFEDLDENIFRAWADVYEKEFRQFFNVPQLGLTRFYQEKINRTLDKFNVFQTTFAEFIRLLYLPMSRSMTVLQEKLGTMVESGQMPEDSKTYYQMWIKILEGHYMTLFQSSEYVQTLEKTLETMSEFSRAKDEVIEDMLTSLPIPRQKDMDELYHEIYMLKKRIKSLEKKNLEK